MKKIIYILSSALCFFNYSAQTTHTVNTGSYYYTPTNLTVQVGDSVIWINDGGFHDVNGNINSITNQPFNNPVNFDSPSTNIVGAVIFSYKFTVPGIYNYDCSVGSHAANGMVGTVVVQSNNPNALTFTAIMDMSLGGVSGRAVMLTANQAIADLSDYTLINYNNGNTTPFRSDVLPSVSVSSGQHVILCRDSTALSNYFDGCLEQFSGSLHPTVILQNSAYPTGNGNDAYELTKTTSGNSLEVYGIIGDNPDTQGAGCISPTCWDTEDSWAWKDTASSNIGNWVYGLVNCTDNSTTTQTSSCPFPLATTVCLTTTSDITFQLDMNQSGYDSTAIPYLRGSWDWGGPGDMMTDSDGDGVWQFTKSLTGGVEYLFAVDTDTVVGWDINESIDPNEPCTNGNSQYTNRVLSVSLSDSTLGIVCLGSCSPCLPPSAGFSDELFFSEYAEGSSSNKYIEIYNGTGIPVDLSNYVMMQNTNGGPWDEYTDELSGTLAHDDVYVIANSSADSLILAEADLTGSGICFFNGDDARALVKVVGTDTIVCDYIGEFPTDPGSGWGVAGVSNGTQNHTLVRKDNVCNGDTIWSNSAGTDSINSQWIVLAQNDWTHLGSHTTNCLPQPPPPPPIVQSLNFTAIMALSVQFITTSPSAGKALMLTANQNISDLSTYGFGCANNGVGSQGEEYTFPNISINAGQHIIVCRDSTALSTYFDGCLEQFPGSLYPNLIIESSGEPTGNGNDAYELFFNGSVIETFGDINHNYGLGGFTDLPWAYRYSWAWKDTAALNVGNWVYGGDNCSDSSTTTQTSSCPFPLCEAMPSDVVSTISNDILIYPNPTNNILNISSISKIMYLEIYNSLGQKVFERSLMSSTFNLDVSSFPNDFYITKVVSKDSVSIVNFIKI